MQLQFLGCKGHYILLYSELIDGSHDDLTEKHHLNGIDN